MIRSSLRATGLVAVAAIALAACGATADSAPETVDPVSQPAAAQDAGLVATTCSAFGASYEPSSVDLPAEIAATRDALLEAATACDFDGLAALAGDAFTYSYGAEDGPAAFWRAEEARGEDVLATLVTLLQLTPNLDEDGVSWPAVAALGADGTDAQWDEVAAVATPEMIELFRTEDNYFGWRTFIGTDGTWHGFVAGD